MHGHSDPDSQPDDPVPLPSTSESHDTPQATCRSGLDALRRVARARAIQLDRLTPKEVRELADELGVDPDELIRILDALLAKRPSLAPSHRKDNP